jgi:hypothetical protein
MTSVRKPAARTVTRYVPAGMAGTWYRPLASVCRVTEKPVAAFATSIDAPETTAPDPSTIRPWTAAIVCAADGAAHVSSVAPMSSKRLRRRLSGPAADATGIVFTSGLPTG